MENKANYLEPLMERAEHYGKTSYELIRLKTLYKTADVASSFVSRGTAILLLSMFVVIANIGVALWLGDILGKSYYGFFCVAGFYGIISFVLYFFMHKSIKKNVSNSIISVMLN